MVDRGSCENADCVGEGPAVSAPRQAKPNNNPVTKTAIAINLQKVNAALDKHAATFSGGNQIESLAMRRYNLCLERVGSFLPVIGLILKPLTDFFLGFRTAFGEELVVGTIV